MVSGTMPALQAPAIPEVVALAATTFRCQEGLRAFNLLFSGAGELSRPMPPVILHAADSSFLTAPPGTSAFIFLMPRRQVFSSTSLCTGPACNCYHSDDAGGVEGDCAISTPPVAQL